MFVLYCIREYGVLIPCVYICSPLKTTYNNRVYKYNACRLVFFFHVFPTKEQDQKTKNKTIFCAIQTKLT